MKNTNNDQKFLRRAQEELDMTATEMAARLETSFNTYKAWLYGKNPLPGVARVAIELLLEKDRVS